MNQRLGFVLGGIATIAVAGAISAGVVLTRGDGSGAGDSSVAAISTNPNVISQLASSLGVSSSSLQTALTQTSPGDGNFIERLAQKLGIDPQVLRDAIKSTGADIIDEAEQNGTITSDMADRLRGLLDDGKLFNLDRLGDIARHFLGGHGHGDGLFGMRSETFSAVATFLGISEDDLRNALANGTTLAGVGEQHGKSRSDMEQFLTDRANANIDQDLKDGKITESQANDLKSHVADAVDHVLDTSFKLAPRAPGFFGHGFLGGAALPDIAGYLGITADQLADALKSGQTLAQVAEAHGKSRDDLQSFIQAKVDANIQSLQDAGKITADQADAMRQRASDAIDRMLDATIHLRGAWNDKGDEGGSFRPGSPASPQGGTY